MNLRGAKMTTWFVIHPTDEEGRATRGRLYFTTRDAAVFMGQKVILGEIKVTTEDVLVLADGSAYRLTLVENAEEHAKLVEGAKAKLTAAERKALGVK